MEINKLIQNNTELFKSFLSSVQSKFLEKIKNKNVTEIDVEKIANNVVLTKTDSVYKFEKKALSPRLVSLQSKKLAPEQVKIKLIEKFCNITSKDIQTKNSKATQSSKNRKTVRFAEGTKTIEKKTLIPTKTRKKITNISRYLKSRDVASLNETTKLVEKIGKLEDRANELIDKLNDIRPKKSSATKITQSLNKVSSKLVTYDPFNSPMTKLKEYISDFSKRIKEATAYIKSAT